ncbi:hypothetical protein ABTK89_19585, partial [Acinetobacter baumannii]
MSQFLACPGKPQLRRCGPFVFRITSMASNAAHHATGWAAGVIAATFVAQASHTSLEHLGPIVAFCAAVAGSTAPDWMEV